MTCAVADRGPSTLGIAGAGLAIAQGGDAMARRIADQRRCAGSRVTGLVDGSHSRTQTRRADVGRSARMRDAGLTQGGSRDAAAGASAGVAEAIDALARVVTGVAELDLGYAGPQLHAILEVLGMFEEIGAAHPIRAGDSHATRAQGGQQGTVGPRRRHEVGASTAEAHLKGVESVGVDAGLVLIECRYSQAHQIRVLPRGLLRSAIVSQATRAAPRHARRRRVAAIDGREAGDAAMCREVAARGIRATAVAVGEARHARAARRVAHRRRARAAASACARVRDGVRRSVRRGVGGEAAAVGGHAAVGAGRAAAAAGRQGEGDHEHPKRRSSVVPRSRP